MTTNPEVPNPLPSKTKVRRYLFALVCQGWPYIYFYRALPQWDTPFG
jgi:hypothetical protein